MDKIIGPNWYIIIPSKEKLEERRLNLSNPKQTTDKECKLCKTIFNYGRSNKKFCDCCELMVKCHKCSKYFKAKDIRLSMEVFGNKEEITAFCNLRCANSFRNSQPYMIEAARLKGLKRGAQVLDAIGKEGKCSICGETKVLIDVSLCCLECSSKQNYENVNKNKEEGPCSVCGAINKEIDQNARGKECGCSGKFYEKHNNSESVLKHTYENLDKLNFRDHKYCEECKDLTPHNGFVLCLICNPIIKNNFITKLNVRYYKGESITNIISKLESGTYDLKDFPGWNKRFDRWCCYTTDVLTDDILLLNGYNFEVQDEELFYLDKTTGKYVLWNDYKNRFKTREDSGQLEEFVPYTTFRTQESYNWDGAIGTFEQSLVDANLTWIVYVKYCVNETSDFNPLVIGKTGSKLVNWKGSNVCFDYDNDGGPARQFLIDEGYEWNKTQIGVIACDSEEEALELEKQLIDKYQIFGS